MSVRTEVAAALVLPNQYRVIPFQAGLDRIEVGKVVVILYRATVRPAPQHQAIVNELEAWVLIPKVKPGDADEALDDALDVVLAAIDTAPGLLWTDAERGVWDDTYPGYKITLTVTTSKEL